MTESTQHVVSRPLDDSRRTPDADEYTSQPGKRQLTDASLQKMLARVDTANGADFKATLPGYALVAVVEELVSWRNGTLQTPEKAVGHAAHKTEIGPFDPNESPLDRIADLMAEHPSRSHSAAVAVYLQQRWEWEREHV